MKKFLSNANQIQIPELECGILLSTCISLTHLPLIYATSWKASKSTVISISFVQGFHMYHDLNLSTDGALIYNLYCVLLLINCSHAGQLFEVAVAGLVKHYVCKEYFQGLSFLARPFCYWRGLASWLLLQDFYFISFSLFLTMFCGCLLRTETQAQRR